MVRTIKNAVKKLPGISALIRERDDLRSQLDHFKSSLFVPPGHFYSPIPSLEDIRRDEAQIFGAVPRELAGIDLHESEQLSLLNELQRYYKELPFHAEKVAGLRYFYENPAYSYSDAIFLYCLIRHLRPKKIIEVGSGYSSCVTLDTNEIFFGNSISTTFIEPFPGLLLSLIKEEDKARITVIPKRLQDVALERFDGLGEGDILFVDSTHVSKVNSDVNRLFFEILPRLAPGVFIHLHDIFYPFEYPKEWAFEGRAWNEAYVLRAFLQYNRGFRIMLMNTFLEDFHEARFREEMPLCLKNKGGSIWLRKESR